MDLNLNLSLDEIIQMKKNKARGDKQAGFRGRFVGGARRHFGRHLGTNRGANGVSFGGKRGGFGNVHVRNNIMRGGKRYNGRGGGGVQRPVARRAKFVRHHVNSLKDKASSTNNMYEGSIRQSPHNVIPTTNINKIVISNLDFGVSSSDIEELFEEFGKLQIATVHYDMFGKSLGTAIVVFAETNSALNAFNQYNNIPLDGRPLKIELATTFSTIDNLCGDGNNRSNINGGPGNHTRQAGDDRAWSARNN